MIKRICDPAKMKELKLQPLSLQTLQVMKAAVVLICQIRSLKNNGLG